MEEKKEIKVATSSEERVSSLLLDAIELHNKFMNITLGLEDEVFNYSGKEEINRRVQALVKSVNSLKQIIRIAKPTIYRVADLTKKDNPHSLLDAVRKDCDEIIYQIDLSEKTKSKKDDMVYEKHTSDGHYGITEYKLTNNFWKLVRELEDYYEIVYFTLLDCGLITPVIKETERRKKIYGF